MTPKLLVKCKIICYHSTIGSKTLILVDQRISYKTVGGQEVTFAWI